MKVIVKHGIVVYNGVRYEAGNEMEVHKEFYENHKQRFLVATKAKGAEKVVTNEEKPTSESTKAKSEETKTEKKPRASRSSARKPRAKKAAD